MLACLWLLWLPCFTFHLGHRFAILARYSRRSTYVAEIWKLLRNLLHLTTQRTHFCMCFNIFFWHQASLHLVSSTGIKHLLCMTALTSFFFSCRHDCGLYVMMYAEIWNGKIMKHFTKVLFFSICFFSTYYAMKNYLLFLLYMLFMLLLTMILHDIIPKYMMLKAYNMHCSSLNKNQLQIPEEIKKHKKL